MQLHCGAHQSACGAGSISASCKLQAAECLGAVRCWLARSAATTRQLTWARIYICYKLANDSVTNLLNFSAPSTREREKETNLSIWFWIGCGLRAALSWARRAANSESAANELDWPSSLRRAPFAALERMYLGLTRATCSASGSSSPLRLWAFWCNF